MRGGLKAHVLCSDCLRIVLGNKFSGSQDPHLQIILPNIIVYLLLSRGHRRIK